MKKFFIVGCGRSGTTMLQQALNRHSQVAIPPETAFFTFPGLSRKAQHEHLRRLNADLHIALPLPRRRIHDLAAACDLFEKMAQLYLVGLGKSGVTHFGEKSPEHLRRLRRLRHMFPDAKVLLLYRDGRDVAWSLTQLPWMSPDLYVNFALWLHYVRLQQRAQRTGDPNLMCMKYEDLVTAPEKQLRLVMEFLDLPYESQVASGHGNAAGFPAWEHPWKSRALEPITPARVGLWRQKLTAAQVDVLNAWGGAVLQELGYERATKEINPLPWWFYARVYVKSLLWLARRPRYGDASEFFRRRERAARQSQESTQEVGTP